MSDHVPISLWGKDHWSTLAYIETRCVDHKGIPDADHMRTDYDLHPMRVGDRKAAFGMTDFKKKYPTRLNDGTERRDHDDWLCLEDAEHEGFVEILGTGVFPVYKLTDKGHSVLAALRKHKAQGKNFGEFRWPSSGA